MLHDAKKRAYLLVLLPVLLAAVVPQATQVQGFLTDRASGTPTPANGIFSMTFAIWDSEFGGAQIRSIGPLSVPAAEGRFDVELPLTAQDFGGAQRYLAITVNGEVLSPRLRLVSVPFSFQAEMSAEASSAKTSDLALQVAPGSVGTAAIAFGAVTAEKLGIPCMQGELLVRGASGWTCSPPISVPICPSGAFVGCYSGPAGTLNVGTCRAGTSACTSSGTEFGPCQGEILPVAEECDGLDNDCDGALDDGNPGGGLPCNTGLPGVCAAGTTSCSTGALQCVPNTPPSAEVCDGLDNNCDGRVDEGCQVVCGDGICAPPETDSTCPSDCGCAATNCASPTPFGCYCDSACVARGDCCVDACSYCGSCT